MGWLADLPTAATASHAIVSSGMYVYPPGVVQSAAALSANYLRFVPLIIPRAFTASRIGLEVTTVSATGAAVIRLGLYLPNGTNGPGALLLDAGTIPSGTTTGFKEITISQAVPHGLVWAVAVAQGADDAQVNGFDTNNLNIGRVGPSGAYSAARDTTYRSNSGYTGALPADASGDNNYSQGFAPMIVLKVA